MVELIDLGPADVAALARFLEEKEDRVAFSPRTQSVSMTVVELQRLVREYGRAFTDALCMGIHD